MAHYSPARIWRYCGVSFLLGIVVSTFDPFYWLICFIGVLFILFLFYPKFNSFLVVFLVILSFVIGFLRYQTASFQNTFRIFFLSEIGKFLRQQVKLQLERTLNVPRAYVLESLLLGHRGNLPLWLYQKFINAGLAHLIAVSGLHLTLIISFVASLGKQLLLPAKLRFLFSIFILLIFVALADFTSSVIRSFIMAGVFLLGQFVYRPYNFTNSLIFAAVIMTFINPSVLIVDLGFQLSFLSILGLGYLYPIFSQNAFWQKEIFRGKLSFLKESFLLSFSSLLMIAPWLLYKTHNLSLIGLLSNVLVLPIIPHLMIGGLLIILLAYISYLLALFVAWLVNFGLKYLLFVVLMFSSFPQLSFKIPFILVLLYYIILVYFIYRRHTNSFSFSHNYDT